MGKVEELDKYLNHHSEPVKDSEIRARLDSIKQEMVRDWAEFKRYQEIMHGERTTDNRLDMLLVFLIKQGIL